MSDQHPFHSATSRPHASGDYSREEVVLANRNSGTLLEGLRHDVTPAGMHYLLNHFDVPYVPEAALWRVAITGRVRAPLTLTMADIHRLPERTLRVTMECAGNGRATVEQRWQSQPWMYEAVGTAEWTGTPLRGILEQAGILPEAIEVAFLGADRGFDRVEHNYGRSLALVHALDPDVLLVHGMNGQPLLPQHGFPLRLIVPGWYGMASVKWIDRIEVLDRPYDGHQQVGTYKYKQEKDDPGIPVTLIRVKSLLIPPGIPDWYTRRRLVEAGPVTIRGRAWSGGGVPVARVEVAVDGVWHTATLDAADVAAGRYAWRGWRFVWPAAAGEHALQCRATDADGDTQPLEPRWDRAGFGNNSMQQVAVTVR